MIKKSTLYTDGENYEVVPLKEPNKYAFICNSLNTSVIIVRLTKKE